MAMPESEPLESSETSLVSRGRREHLRLVEPLEAEHTMLDLSMPEMTQRFAESPLYYKSAVVTARVAEAGERVTTTLADGRTETVNIANEGDYVITDAAAEQYIVKPDYFGRAYEPQEDGTYRARGACRAFANPSGKDIVIVAPWGQQEYGAADAMLVVAVDPEKPDVIGSNRYIIDRKDFLDTYILAE